MLNIVEGLYCCLLKDMQAIHPSIHEGLQRDFSRLLDVGSRQGLKFYTIVLPQISKFLLGSLEMGALLESRPAFCGVGSKTDSRPTLFRGLWSSVFQADGTLSVDPDIQSIRSIYQISNLMKKLRIECDEQFKLEAYSAFEDIEECLPRSWPDTWDYNDPHWCTRSGHPIWGPELVDDRQANLLVDTPAMYGHDVNLDWKGFRNFVARFSSQLGDIHSSQLDEGIHRPILPKHGPGAVSDKTSYTKYDGKFWTDRLQSVFPYDYWASPSLEVPSYVEFREFPSQLHAVPKDQKGPRLIAAEPTAHQWMQGFIRLWLEKKLRTSVLSSSIDFRSQAHSRELALESSRTQSHATIDLSSASDRLTTRLVEFCFQSNRSLLDALAACRTRCVRMPDGTLIELRKFATQGSAVTFPVQSICFALIAIWAVALTRGKTDWSSLRRFALEVRVFGDDIILPTDAYPVCALLLEECKLKVNATKSFYRGKFRESCGMDAYDGEDITPTYIRELNGSTADTLESVVESSNNLHKAGYWNTADKLLKTLTPQDIQRIPVKSMGSGAFALSSFCGSSVSHLIQRWNRHLHSNEVKALLVQTAVRRARGKGHGDLLQFFIEEPDKDLPYQGGQVSRPKQRKMLRWVDPVVFD